MPLGALDPDVAPTLHNNGAPPELFYNIVPQSSFVFLQLNLHNYMLRTLVRMAPKTWTKESFTVRTVSQDCEQHYRSWQRGFETEPQIYGCPSQTHLVVY
jgi:hypothetical protein